MRAVHIGIGHNDDAVVTQLLGIEFFLADTCTQRSNQSGDFLTGEHFSKRAFPTFKILPLSGKIA